MNVNFVGIVTCIIAALNILLGIVVLSKNSKNANNRVYALSVVSIAIWAISTFFYNNPIFLSAKDWLKIVYVASYGMLAAQITFCFFFPKRKKDKFLIYLIPLVISLLPSLYVLLIQDSVIISATTLSESFYSVATMGSGYLIYTIPNVLGIILLSIYFLNKSKDFVGYEKAQVQFYYLGIVLMMVPITILDYALPIISGNTEFFVYGPLFAIPFTISGAYSIIENRFTTIKSILKTVAELIINLFFLVCALFLYSSLSKEFGWKDADFIIFTTIFGVVSILLYLFVLRKVVLFLSNIVFGKDVTLESLKSFSQINNMELDLDRISVNVKRTIRSILGINKVGILLFDKNISKVLYKNLNDFQMLGSRDLLEIIHYWDQLGSDPILVLDEIKRSFIFGEEKLSQRLERIIVFTDKYEISAILPLNRRTQLNGIVLLGYRSDKFPLTVQDIQVLEQIISNTSVSMGRALLYREVQAFSETLKEKVDDQTKELQFRLKELEEARRKEADMIDIMGHELRTPATVVKLNAQLLEKFVGKINEDKEDFDKYLKRIKIAVENEIKLINTLLSSAKLEGDKIELNPEDIDIGQEIEMAIHGLEKDVEQKGLKIFFEEDPSLPHVYADKARTIEILNNLLSNAVKYTNDGYVKIKIDSDNDYVKVLVIDTGDGISKENIPKLGQKFYRVGNYLQGNDEVNIVRPGGTGLGLYVTFNLVKRMGGEIRVGSEVGKGSVFGFTLPKYKGQVSFSRNLYGKNMFEKLGLKR